MTEDVVRKLVRQWAVEQPRMDTAALEAVVRLQHLAKQLQARSKKVLAAHNLKHPEYDVLSVLRRQGEPYELPANEISKAALLTTGAMTTRIDGLESRGLVRRRQAKEDRRSVLVRLTPKGLSLVDDAIGTRVADADELLAALSIEEVDQLVALLAKVSQSVER